MGVLWIYVYVKRGNVWLIGVFFFLIVFGIIGFGGVKVNRLFFCIWLYFKIV